MVTFFGKHVDTEDPFPQSQYTLVKSSFNFKFGLILHFPTLYHNVPYTSIYIYTHIDTLDLKTLGALILYIATYTPTGPFLKGLHIPMVRSTKPQSLTPKYPFILPCDPYIPLFKDSEGHGDLVSRPIGPINRAWFGL